MIKGESESALTGINGQIGVLKEEINAITNSYKHLRTPVDAVGTYLSLCEQRPLAVNKKRKEIERAIQQLQDAHKFIDKDKSVVIKCDAKQRELDEMILSRDNVSKYIDNKINSALELLIKNGFVTCRKEDILLGNTVQVYELTFKGTYAVHLREINCLVFAQLFADGVFDKLSALQCAMVFSCFTNVNVNDNDKSLTAKCCDDTVQSVVETIFSSLQFYLKEENDNNISTGINYDIHYDLLDYVSEWWACESEPECKIVIQNIAADKGVFLGEFVKALLKINNVSAELQSIAEQTGNMELLQKLQSIPLNTLKFVATNQSLYV
jgi:superfamily II RNA helicase